MPPKEVITEKKVPVAPPKKPEAPPAKGIYPPMFWLPVSGGWEKRGFKCPPPSQIVFARINVLPLVSN